jgi:flagellar basal-body rod protein FlgB
VDFAQAPFFSLLRAQLDHLGARQKLVAENIANASTPGYVPRDTDEKSFARAMAAAARQGGGLSIARTDAGHMGGFGAAMTTKIVTAPDSETTLDGNAVVLEDQMLKSAETRMGYETSLALYQKGLELMRLAIKAPGK